MTRQITSCLTCRRRKVRCDRALPVCLVCAKGSYPCSYRMPERDRRRGRSSSPASNTSLSNLQNDPSNLLRLANSAATRHAVAPRIDIGDVNVHANGHSFKGQQTFEIYPYNKQTTSLSLNGLILGCSSDTHNALQFYPSTRADARYLLHQFLLNFDRAIHLCHRPTLQHDFDAHVAGLPASVPSADNFQSLTFALFFAAIYTMKPDEVAAKFNSSKATMLQRFQNGLALALDWEGFLSKPSIPVLQAFVLFMVRNLTACACMLLTPTPTRRANAATMICSKCGRLLASPCASHSP